MENQDTVSLLRECNAGSKMAVTSLDEVLDKIQDSKMKSLLLESKEHHEKLGNEIHTLLLRHGSDEKDPNPIAKSMSWMKTNMKLVVDESDETIADLMTDGCNMGVKSQNKYLNQYQAAEEETKDFAKQLIRLEEKLAVDIRRFL